MKQVLPRLLSPQTPGWAFSLKPPSAYVPEVPLKLYLLLPTPLVLLTGLASFLPLSSGAGGGAGIGDEDPREAAPMLFVLLA